MLKELQKALGLGKEAAKPEVTESLAITFNAEDIQTHITAVADAFKLEFEAYKETAEGMVATLTEELSIANMKLEATQEALAAVLQEQATQLADAEAKRLSARKELVVAAIGTERADALLSATEGFDETAFAAVVSALSVSAKVETNSPLFKEIGVTAEADSASAVESKEMQILKKKYPKK